MPRELTGRMVLAIFIAFVGTYMAANFLMAWMAVGTFPGLVVKNSYVASQEFNSRLEGQLRLGWKTSLTYGDGVLELRILNADGTPAAIRSLKATIGRTTVRSQDVTLSFSGDDITTATGIFREKLPLAPGKWEMWLDAVARDGTPFRQRLRLFVPG